MVTALVPGTATITAASAADATKTAECVVTVAAPEPDLVDGQVITYMKSTKPREVPLIFVGEGFTAEHMGPKGLYRTTLAQLADGVFDIEPFKSYKEYFSVYFVAAVGREEGVGTPGHPADNALGIFVNDRGLGLISDREAGHQYAAKVPLKGDNGALIVVINARQPNGSRPWGSWASDQPEWKGGGQASIGGTHTDLGDGMQYTTIHELGHAFAFLEDEYFPSSNGTRYDDQQLAERHNQGMNMNVSATADPTKVPWAHFIGHPNYPYVGVYEGAAYVEKGRWRSESTRFHMMGDFCPPVPPGYGYDDRVNGPYFNAICREMIVKRIKKIAGEPYSFEEFVAKDKYEPNLVVPWL